MKINLVRMILFLVGLTAYSLSMAHTNESYLKVAECKTVEQSVYTSLDLYLCESCGDNTVRGLMVSSLNLLGQVTDVAAIGYAEEGEDKYYFGMREDQYSFTFDPDLGEGDGFIEDARFKCTRGESFDLE